MKKSVLLGVFLISLAACSQQNTVVRLAVTTDVHGMIFPYDFISRKPADNSLAHIYSYVEEKMMNEDTLFFLMDNGDFLQGQPTVYYYNFVDTLSPHLSTRVMNRMGYVAGTVGNHDIETGPAVYNRVRSESRFPCLAANAVSTKTGEPFFEPYTILKAGRKKIAVLGLITPGIPKWLPENLWPGLEFRDMVETTREPGGRVSILGFTNGNPFLIDKTYSVAINSYRGNGGGGHLIKGAAIPAEELAGRVSWSTDKDLRYHLMEYLRQYDTLKIENYDNWKCIPSQWLIDIYL